MFKTLVNRADTNLFRHLDYLLIRHCGASHILDRKCISHDTLIISYTSKCNQHCLPANNTDWNIHLRVNKIVTKVKVTAVTRPGNISDKCFTLVQHEITKSTAAPPPLPLDGQLVLPQLECPVQEHNSLARLPQDFLLQQFQFTTYQPDGPLKFNKK